MAEQGGNIKTFSAGDGPAINTDKSNEAATQLSRSASIEGGYYKQAGESYAQAGKTLGDAIDNHEYMTEVSNGAPALAATLNNQLNDWRQAVTQPGATNDPDLQKKFIENNLQPALEKWQDGFSTDRGQKYAIDEVNREIKEFYHSSTADVMNVTGEQRIQDLTTFANQNGEIVRKDPMQADAAIARINAHVEALKVGLPSEKANMVEKLGADQRDEVAKIQVMALADKGNVGAAKAALDAQGAAGHITPVWQEQLVGYIAAQKVAREVQADQARQQQQYKDIQVNEQTTKSIFSDMSQGKVIPATTAYSAKGLSPEQRRDLISSDKSNPGILQLPQKWLTSSEYGPGFAATAEAIQRGEGVTPGGLTKGVRMYATNPSQAITPAGAARLQEIQDKMKTPEGAMEVQAQNAVLADMQYHLMPAGAYATDPKGKAIYSGMQNSFYTLWDKEIQSGKTPAELADPDSKDYIGNAFMNLKRKPAQALSDLVNARPGEEPDHLTQLDNARKQKIELPAADKRVVGQTYPTPRGPMVWQEGGWAQPKAKE